MYKTILVPLDGSKRAEVILPHVEELAQRFEAKVIFLGVIEPETVIVSAEPVFTQIDDEAIHQRLDMVKTYLNGMAGEFREKGITARIHFNQGPVVESIIQAAEKEDADLIAMASHGRTGLSRVFYGSVAAGILHRVDRPLLLIRALDN